MANPQTETKVISNFALGGTRFDIGPMDSGLSKILKTFGGKQDFSPPSLAFLESPVQVSSANLTTSDLIVAGRTRVESGITYLYCITHTAKLLKIQVNAISPPSPNNETITLLATLSSNSPTFKYSTSLIFATDGGDSTEKIFIGHDIGVTKIKFDGTGETFVGVAGSYTANVPRPVQAFGQFLYYGNGSNFVELTLSTATITSYAKLSPGFAANTQIRDLDVSLDGRYLIASLSRTSQVDVTSSTVDSGAVAATDAIIAYWNGTDVTTTSFTTIPSFTITAYATFGNKEYSFGYDAVGAAVFNPLQKELSMFYSDSPFPNAIGFSGNYIGWFVPMFNPDTAARIATFWLYGNADKELPLGWFNNLQMSATAPQTDIIRVPFGMLATNIQFGASFNYPNVYYGATKVYFSTVEYNGSAAAYRFYYLHLAPVGLGTAMPGVYETQTEIFSKRKKCPEYRVYLEPTASTQFQIDLIDPSNTVIASTTNSFTPASTDDMVRFNPTHRPVGGMGVRITNQGTITPIIRKIEVDLIETNA